MTKILEKLASPQKRAAIIQKATQRARKDWEHYTALQEKQIYRLFDNAASEISARLARYESMGKMPPSRLLLLQKQVKRQLTELRIGTKRIIKRAMSKSIDDAMKASIKAMDAVGLPSNYNIQIGSSFIGKDGIVRRYDVHKEVFATSTWAKINGNAMDAVMRFRPSGLTFSEDVWNLTWNAERAIRNRINTGILLGDSAAKVSRDIRGFLSEPHRLYRRVRKDGKLVLSKAAKAYHPGQGVYRSSYKSAMRLARTEMNRAYHEGAVRYAQQKDWIDGVIWRTGSGAPCPICSDMDGVFYPKNEIPAIPHPQCMCHTDIHIKEK